MTWFVGMLIGVIAGLILGVLIDKDTVFKGVVKIKQKGRGNTLDGQLEANISPKQARRNKRIDRRNKRKARKTLKLIE